MDFDNYAKLHHCIMTSIPWKQILYKFFWLVYFVMKLIYIYIYIYIYRVTGVLKLIFYGDKSLAPNRCSAPST